MRIFGEQIHDHRLQIKKMKTNELIESQKSFWGKMPESRDTYCDPLTFDKRVSIDLSYSRHHTNCIRHCSHCTMMTHTDCMVWLAEERNRCNSIVDFAGKQPTNRMDHRKMLRLASVNCMSNIELQMLEIWKWIFSQIIILIKARKKIWIFLLFFKLDCDLYSCDQLHFVLIFDWIKTSCIDLHQQTIALIKFAVHEIPFSSFKHSNFVIVIDDQWSLIIKL